MRIRIGKGFSRNRRKGSQRRFAFLPKRLSNGVVVWLEFYRRIYYYSYYGCYYTSFQRHAAGQRPKSDMLGERRTIA